MDCGRLAAILDGLIDYMTKLPPPDRRQEKVALGHLDMYTMYPMDGGMCKVDKVRDTSCLEA